MAAAEATLTKVLTPEAYEQLERRTTGCSAAATRSSTEYGLPCYTQGIGAKGCVVFSPEPLREYRDYLTKVDGDLSTLAWLYHMNHGIFMTPGRRGGVDALDRPLAGAPPGLRRRARGVRARRHGELAGSVDGGRAGGPAVPGRVVDQLRARRPGARVQGHRGPVGADRLLQPRPGGGDQRAGPRARDRGRGRGDQRFGRDHAPPRPPHARAAPLPHRANLPCRGRGVRRLVRERLQGGAERDRGRAREGRPGRRR